MIYDNIGQLIGNTPMVRLHSVDKDSAEVLVKLESMNPGGSVKERIALNIIEEMEKRGELKPGMKLVEPTSGNTGIGLSMVAAYKGYSLTLVMPNTMSMERRKILKAYGADLVLTDGSKGMRGAIEKADEIQSSSGDTVLIGQFQNPDNPKAHEKTTGPEILKDTDGRLDAFVVGIGTGGTITGAGGFLKEKLPNLKVIGVEPVKSPVISGGEPGPHKIQGIGAGFIPEVLNKNTIDEMIQVSEEEAIAESRHIAAKEGLLLGISGGAAIFAAKKTARELGPGKRVVVIAPDTGERYLSTELFEFDD
ncbi:cysteine synthase A [Isachenkonia alkalipeptolytica]|uniref:Cysteine synthase n=1 Tax=Isachenkonia alkalipeptolytica TaxID=2565777 RepID=A0AA44BFP0_9CLOT|nr:cysteine synthase A [Isachenkonia alkalipeptolytica]NBG88676.1 cysteine synthase A [Isachenkonia alkalipeptolytica]